MYNTLSKLKGILHEITLPIIRIFRTCVYKIYLLKFKLDYQSYIKNSKLLKKINSINYKM